MFIHFGDRKILAVAKVLKTSSLFDRNIAKKLFSTAYTRSTQQNTLSKNSLVKRKKIVFNKEKNGKNEEISNKNNKSRRKKIKRLRRKFIIQFLDYILTKIKIACVLVEH